MKKFQWQPYLSDEFLPIWKKILSNTKSSGSRAAFMTKARKGVMPDHNITVNDLMGQYARQKGRCYWSGVPLRLEYQNIHYHPLGVSVDRIYNDKGYCRENIVLTARMVNLGKNQYPSQDFPAVMEEFKKEVSTRWWEVWK